MRLTLDWDTEAEMERELPQLNPDAAEEMDLDLEQTRLSSIGETTSRTVTNPWELRRSSSGDGYHYIEYDYSRNWNDVVDARNEYGDDKKRLRLDLMRRQRGSPFLQVLYGTKYMDRGAGYIPGGGVEFKPESGNQSTHVAGEKFVSTEDATVKRVSEPDRIKTESGRLLYQKIARILAEEEYGSQTALAESIGFARSTVGGWVRGEHEPSEAAQKKLRRRARGRGIGHYVETDDGGKSADRLDDVEVQYWNPDEKDQRRTLVEYADAPWTTNEGGKRDKEKEYALLNVHTGSYNENHTENQLKMVHDQVMKRALRLLSPYPLNLDRQTNESHRDAEFSREADSLNYENELLDENETEFYLDQLVERTSEGHEIVDREIDPEKAILFEVILWTEDMSDLIWHVIGVWNSSPSDSLIVEDSAGWWE